VAHENGGRLEVVPQKRHRRARQGPGERRVPPRALLREGDTEEKCRDCADAGRNPIHVVQQIERVGQRHKPKHRRHDVHDVPRRQSKGCPGADQSDTHKGLKNELELWPQVQDVVNQTNSCSAERSYSITDCSVSSRSTCASYPTALRICSSEAARRCMSSNFSPYPCPYGVMAISDFGSLKTRTRSARSATQISCSR